MIPSRLLRDSLILFLLPVPAALAQTDASWVNPAGGSWFTPTNWSGGQVPNNGAGQTFNVAIDLVPVQPYTVLLDNDVALDSLELDSVRATLRAAAGTFRVLGSATLMAGTFSLDGATLEGGAWSAAPGTVSIGTSAGSRLRGLTWNGDLPLATNGAQLRIAGGLRLGGQLSLTAPNTAVVYEGVQTLEGGTVLVSPSSGSASLNLPAGAELTLSATTVVRGGGAGGFSGAGHLINDGLIVADRVNNTLTMAPSLFTNRATMQALTNARLTIGGGGSTWDNAAGATITVAGGTLSLLGAWSNLGLIQADGATVNLGGSFSTPSLAGFQRNGGTVNLTGTLDNAGHAIALDNGTGPWRLAGGRIMGGSFSVSDSTPLTVTGVPMGRLSGVLFSGPVIMAGSSSLLIDADCTLPSRVSFPNGNAGLIFGGQRVIDGLPLTFSASANSITVDQDGALTLGPNQRLEGGNLQIRSRGSNNRVRNEGLIRVAATQAIEITPDLFENAGLCEATGGSLRFGYATAFPSNTTWYNLPGGVIRATNATLDLAGTWSNSGLIEAVNSTVNMRGACRSSDLTSISRQGGVVHIMGMIDNAGANIALNQQTGSWNMEGGTIRGGSIQFADGATLTFTEPTGGGFVSTFYDITFNGDLALRSSSAWGPDVYFGRDVVLNGVLTLGRNASLRLQPDRLWSVPTVFEVASSASLWANEPGQITFPPGTLLSGPGSISFSQGALGINRGTIRCEAVGGGVGVSGDFTNESLIEGRNGGACTVGAGGQMNFINAQSGVVAASGGGAVQVWGNWQNHGLITVSGGPLTVDFSSESARNFGTVEATDSTVLINWRFRNSGLVRVVNSNVTFNCDLLTSELTGFQRTGGTVALRNGTLDNRNQTFTLNAATGAWILGNNGRILGGVIDQQDGVRLQYGGAAGSPSCVLDGVTIRGGINLDWNVRIDTGLTLETGSVVINPSGTMRVSGGVTLDNMMLEFVGPDDNSKGRLTSIPTSNGPVVLGPGFYAHGGAGAFSGDSFNSSDGGLLNRGTIIADRVGRRIAIENDTFTNAGLIGTADGGTLQVGRTTTVPGAAWTNAPTGRIIANSGVLETRGNWTNQGVFEAHNATVLADGHFSSTSLESVVLDNSSLSIRGTLNNSNHTLVIDPFRAGHWSLSGTINGGAITSDGGAALNVLTGSLVGVTLAEGELRVGTRARVIGGADGMLLNNVYITSFADGGFQVDDSQPLSGVGEIVFNPASTAWSVCGTVNHRTLTIGPGIRIHGANGTVGRTSTGVVNQGMVSADVAGRTINVVATDLGRITNAGLFEARNGGRLFIETPTTLTNRVGNSLVGGRWSVYAGSTLDLPSTAIEINSAEVLMSGPSSLFAALNPINDNRGSFTLDDGRDFTTAAALANSGRLHLGDGSTLIVSGALTLIANGLFEVDLGGLDPATQFGNAFVAGSAALDGRFAAVLLPGFAPRYGDVFRVLEASARVGEFASVSLPELGGGLSFELVYLGNGLQLVVVPEPATIVLALALIAVGTRRRRT